MAKNATKKIKDSVGTLIAFFNKLSQRDVLVGVPAEKTERDAPMNNATIAYIQDNGAPEAGIPARPFMRPGVSDAKEAIESNLKRGAKLAATMSPGVDACLTKVGLAAQNAIKARITSNIDPALKPATIAARNRSRGTKGKRKGEKEYAKLIGQGMSPEVAQGAAGIVALVNSAQMLNSITFVLRDGKKK